MYHEIENYWQQLAAIACNMPFDDIARAAELLLQCRARGGTIFVFGNGGSAATASHFVCDLAKGTQTAGVVPFRVIALTDNAALITAWANDTAYERIFAEQLRTLVRPQDVVIAISASGNSPNVLAGLEVARDMLAYSIALTGPTGGACRDLVDLLIEVPGGTIEQIEDAHAATAHSLCVVIRKQLQSSVEVSDWPVGVVEVADCSLALGR